MKGVEVLTPSEMEQAAKKLDELRPLLDTGYSNDARIVSEILNKAADEQRYEEWSNQQKQEKIEKIEKRKNRFIEKSESNRGSDRGKKQIEAAFRKLGQATKDEDIIGWLSRIEMNVMNGAGITEEQQAEYLAKVKEMQNKGYEWEGFDEIGKNFDERRKAIATPVLDESLPDGARVIRRVIKPQINKDGKMIQAGEFVFAFNDVLPQTDHGWT